MKINEYALELLLRYGRKHDGAWSDPGIVGEDGDLPDDGDAPVLARAYEYQQQMDELLEALEYFIETVEHVDPGVYRDTIDNTKQVIAKVRREK
jgi:hypothetical protein